MAGPPEGQEAGPELAGICSLIPLFCWPLHRMFSITPDPEGPPPLSAKFWNGMVNCCSQVGILILSNHIPATRNEVRGALRLGPGASYLCREVDPDPRLGSSIA